MMKEGCLVIVKQDVFSNKKSKSTKDEGMIIYAKANSVAKIIKEHGDVLICEPYNDRPGTFNFNNRFPVHKSKVKEKI